MIRLEPVGPGVWTGGNQSQDGKFQKVLLCYIEGDETARRMYEKLGFRLTGERGGDEIVMRKWL